MDRRVFAAPGDDFGVAVADGYAYLTSSGRSTFRIIDVSTPSAPAEVAFLDALFAAHGVTVSGGYVDV